LNKFFTLLQAIEVETYELQKVF